MIETLNDAPKIKVYAVVGATASGKSSLALALAERYGGEIISCDSMQVYKRMNIGTAKPTAEEMSRVRHHLIDVSEPTEPFSCADYVKLADAAVRDCHGRGKIPIICGGTGLYLDALLRESDFEEGVRDDAVRDELFAFAEAHGNQALYDELMAVDPESALATHPNNLKRVVRALEIFRTSGKKKSELDRLSREGGDRYDARVVGLYYRDRGVLYRRIEERVDAMMRDGLLEETRALIAEGVFEKNNTAAQAIGYKELIAYVNGGESLSEATDRLKTSTRRYAKRQMTWFSAKEYVRWLDVMGVTDGSDENGIKTFEEIVNNASKLFFN